MKKFFHNNLINSLLVGIISAFVLFISRSLVFRIFHLKFLLLTQNTFLTYLLFTSIVEEGIKFLFARNAIFGLGFGIAETILKYPFSEFGLVFGGRIPPILMHTITAAIICYFRKKKPVLGLLLAIIIHTLYNFLILG